MCKHNTGTYVSVLAFLLVNSECRFITRFIAMGYSDQKLSPLPILTELEFNELLELDMGCSHADYIMFFQFFIPVLRYEDLWQAGPRTIHQLETLSFNTIREIGRGAYSKVFEAVMLEGYHNFNEVKVCSWSIIKSYRNINKSLDERIAVEVYSHESIVDCVKEMENNVRYNHQRVMPLQSAISYREIFMCIYPLAQGYFKSMLKKPVPHGWDAMYVWSEFAGLLSALYHIHTSANDGYGYHCDLSTGAIPFNLGEFANYVCRACKYTLLPWLFSNHRSRSSASQSCQ
jgi:hypothetical protein